MAEKYGVTRSVEQCPIAGSEVSRNILNAFPTPVLIVDFDLKIIFRNSAAAELMCCTDDSFMKRSGEAMNCVRSADVREGCGHSASCNECVIRNAVYEAICGNRVCRRQTSMMLIRSDRIENVEFIVTTSPLSFERRSYSLLILEAVGRDQAGSHGSANVSSVIP